MQDNQRVEELAGYDQEPCRLQRHGGGGKCATGKDRDIAQRPSRSFDVQHRAATTHLTKDANPTLDNDNQPWGRISGSKEVRVRRDGANGSSRA